MATRTLTDTARIAWTETPAGAVSADIVADSITNALAANVPTATIKGRSTAGTGDPEDLTAAQAASLLDSFFLTLAEGNAAYQPLDADLTAIAALTTTSFGRGLLELANGDALAAEAGGRELLTASRTYFVRTDGSDSNTGLVDSAGGAFLTLQKAADVIAETVDLGGQTVTVQVRDGTFNGNVSISAPWTGSGQVVFVGNTGTPGNCILNASGANGNCFLVGGYGYIQIAGGFRLQASGSGSRALQCDTHGFIYVTGVIEFDDCNLDQVHISAHGHVRFDTNYTILGDATTHATVLNNGIFQCQSNTITLTGTPALSTAFFDVARGGVVRVNGSTYSGAATGARFNVQDGFLSTGAADPDVSLPGNAAGTWELFVGNEAGTQLQGVNGQRIQSLAPNASAGFLGGRFGANASGGYMALVKSRNASIGSHTVVQSGDQLGQLVFAGSDGADFEQAALIRGEVDGTPGNNDMPGRLVFLTTPDGSATPVEGARLDSVGRLLASLPLAGIGYRTGAGGAVTQATNKATGVTLNAVCGQITMNNAALNAGTEVSFTVTNSAVAATDTVIVNIASAATVDAYMISVTAVAAGSFRIGLTNVTAATNPAEALVLNFAVIKAVAA